MIKYLLGLMILASAAFSFAQTVDESSLSVDTLRLRCDQGVNRTEEYFENGQTNDATGFLKLSHEALETCRIFSLKAHGFNGMAGFTTTGKRLCKLSADQRSDLHHGLCILKLSQTVRTMAF